MPTGFSFGSLLNGLSLMNKDNANNAAAKDRQAAGDAAAMERLLKSLAQTKELAAADQQFRADQSYLDRGQRTFERNEDWARGVELQRQRDESQRERDAQQQADTLARIAKEQEFAAGAPERASKARLAEEEILDNRRLLRSMRAADALGGGIGLAYDINDPNVGRALDAQAVRQIAKDNPAVMFPGVASRQVSEGIDPLTGKPKASRLKEMFDEEKPSTTSGRPAQIPLMRLKKPGSAQEITNSIINGLKSLGRSPMID